MGNDATNSEDETKQLLLNLSIYAKEHNLSNRSVAEKLSIPYDTLRCWGSFTNKKDVKKPSKPNLNKIKAFLEVKGSPEVYAHIEESKHRAQKIKYLLLLLEDELRWFKDTDQRAREEFRKELNASDIGYISSLLTMLTEEDKFDRWLALTTARFQSFKRR